jgi:putative polyhydroxyalkanoate system protein
MPKLAIEHRHNLAPDIVRERLKALQARLSEKYGLSASWISEKEATIKGTGASGTIRCEPERVVVNVDLSFALTPLKGQVEQRIRHELERALSTPPA